MTGGVVFRDPPLYPGDMDQGSVPVRLKLAGNRAVLGIGGVVPTERAANGVAGRIEVATERLARFVLPLRHSKLRIPRGLDRSGPHDGKQSLLRNVVDAQAAERDAGRLAVVHPPAHAGIAGNVVPGTGVLDGELPATTSAMSNAR